MQMSNCKAKLHYIRFRLGNRPTARFKGLISKGGGEGI